MPTARPPPELKAHQIKQLSREELESHLEVLHRRFVEVRTQRDELSRDVELNSTSATFDKSSFLQERARNAETELARVKAKLSAVTLDLNDVREDQAHVLQAKRVADLATREVPLSF